MHYSKTALLRSEGLAIIRIGAAFRNWRLSLVTGAAAGLCLWFGHLTGEWTPAKLASLGALALFSVGDTDPASQRRAFGWAAMGLLLGIAVTLLFQGNKLLAGGYVALFAGLMHRCCEVYRAPAPGAFFLVTAAAMTTQLPPGAMSVVSGAAAVTAGIAAAWLMLLLLQAGNVEKTGSNKKNELRLLLAGSARNSFVFAGAVGLTLVAGHAFGLAYPYWVTVSCLAILQGGNWVNMARRTVQRTLGTLLGLFVTALLLEQQPGTAVVAALVAGLIFITDLFIVRQYALAVVFMTPMAILMAEMGKHAPVNPAIDMQHRLICSLVGSAIALLAGALLAVKKGQGVASEENVVS